MDCAQCLVIRGPNALVRNLMKVAGITPAVAVGLSLESAGVVDFSLAGAVLGHDGLRPIEEDDLLERFGEEDEHDQSEVPRWRLQLRPYRSSRSEND